MKGILVEMASKRALPSDIPGGGGGNERVGSLLDTLFESCFLKVLLNDIFEPSDIILEPLGFYFGSLWGVFL